MPKTKTAEKSARSALRKQMRNKATRSATKTQVGKAEQLITAKKADEAKEAVTSAISALDRAAKKKVIHPNTAARKKSRIVKKLNKLTKND